MLDFGPGVLYDVRMLEPCNNCQEPREVYCAACIASLPRGLRRGLVKDQEALDASYRRRGVGSALCYKELNDTLKLVHEWFDNQPGRV
jgi:hypothetical protein